MSRVAQLDPRLTARVVGSRTLHYSVPAPATEDRPDHVRAGSGLVLHGGRLLVVQDDASFLAVVTDDGVAAVKLPRGLDGRRRFEVALGNRLDKIDLESCVAIDDELWAFGSGSLPIREKLCRIKHGLVRVMNEPGLYQRLRDALGGGVNLEGAARVDDELWLFHRGNTGPTDAGPAVARYPLPEVRAWLDAKGPLPTGPQIEGYELGEIDGARLGFTDAIAVGDHVFYLACAEHAPNAIDDGEVAGSQLGVIDAAGVRAASLVGLDGRAVKAEGLALDPSRPGFAWVVLDPDDPEQPTELLDVELTGPWSVS